MDYPDKSVKRSSHYVENTLTGEFAEMHVMELPFYEKRIAMRLHKSRLDFLMDLIKNDELFN